MEGKQELKIIILGESGVGKSCLLERYLFGTFEDSNATIGVEMKEKEVVIAQKNFLLEIWDTAGQERFHSLRTPFYRGAHACMLVFAVDRKDSFTRLTNWLKELKEFSDIEDLHRFPVVVVGNKADVDDNLRQVSEDEARKWACTSGPFPYVESSAKDILNVTFAFESVVRTFCNLRLDQEACSTYSNGVVHLAPELRTPSRRCCL